MVRKKKRENSLQIVVIGIVIVITLMLILNSKNENIVGKTFEDPAGRSYISCVDEEGFDYFSKGLVKVNYIQDEQTNQIIVEDECEGNQLKEPYCDGNKNRDVVYNCVNGCVDGACVAEESICGDGFCFNEENCAEDCDSINIFVDVNGNDNNPGTLNSPVKTLEKAREKIRQSKESGNYLKPTNVNLRGGTYEISQSFILGSEDSGTAEYPITYTSYKGEEVIIRGGSRITNWKKFDDNIYRVEVGDLDFRTLYVNGKRATEAREPDVGYENVFEPVVDDNDFYSFSKVGNWKPSDFTSGFYGKRYYVADKGDGSSIATWKLPVKESGTYNVFARWSAGSNRATKAEYTIYHKDGETVKKKDQTKEGNRWVKLGTFELDENSYVTLSNNFNRGQVVIADAIAVVQVGLEKNSIINELDASKNTKLMLGKGQFPNFDFSDASVYIWSGEPNLNFHSETIPIENVDFSTGIVTLRDDQVFSIRGRERYGTIKEIELDDRFYLQGALEFLDQPGEWYLDRSEGYLYYWPKSLPITQEEIIRPQVKNIIHLEGGTYRDFVTNVKFEGLTFTDSDFVDFSGAYFVGEGCAGIYAKNTENIKVLNSKINNIGCTGVLFDKHSKNNEVVGNEINNVGVHGVWLHGQYPWSEEGALGNGNNIITDNHITNGGQLAGFGSGVIVYYSGENEISYNKITRMPRLGIYLIGLDLDDLQKIWAGFIDPYNENPQEPYIYNQWDVIPTRNNVVSFNEISEVLQDSQDGGGINTWSVGKGNLISNNFIHDLESPIEKGAIMGIYLDEHSDHIIVKNNIIYNVKGDIRPSFVFMRGINNIFSNNILVNTNYEDSILNSWSNQDRRNDGWTFTKNIIYNENYPVAFQFKNYDEGDIIKMSGNVYWNNNGGIRVSINNQLMSFGDWKKKKEDGGLYGVEQNSVVADPMFVDLENLNFRLKPGSPALAKGFKQINMNFGPRE